MLKERLREVLRVLLGKDKLSSVLELVYEIKFVNALMVMYEF